MRDSGEDQPVSRAGPVEDVATCFAVAVHSGPREIGINGVLDAGDPLALKADHICRQAENIIADDDFMHGCVGGIARLRDGFPDHFPDEPGRQQRSVF